MNAPEWDQLSSSSEIKLQYELMRAGFIRYEKIRRLSPRQFQAIYNKCFDLGSRFDSEVDKLPI